MTENNCDFNQEPGVGNTVNVSQEIKEINVPAEESKPEINDNNIASQKALKNDSPDQLNKDSEDELKNASQEELKSDFQDELRNDFQELKYDSQEESENDLQELTNNFLEQLENCSQDELSVALSREKDINSEVTSLECEEKYHSLQDHWLKFSTFFRKVYHTTLDGEKPPDDYECHMDIVKELVANDPHQLFARLEMDLQEFIIEVKLRQMELLNCIHTDEGPHLFIYCLIECYNKVMFAASTLSPLLLQLEIEHLANFNITWRGLNQHLFHKLVFTEPKIQKVLPFCISKLGKMNTELSDFNKRSIQKFLTFDDEMTKIGGKWREAESAIIKYHQENSMLDAKERMMKVNWELIKTQTKAFHDELKSSGLCDNYFSESLKKIKNEIENSQDQPICDCCQLSTTQCLTNSVPLSLESFMDMKAPTSFSQFESSCQDADILAHLNADGKKMYSHLHKFKAQQLQQQQQPTTNGVKSPQTSPTAKPIKDNVENTVLNDDNTGTGSPQQQRQNAQSLTSPIELHKTLIRKQQHQKKLMQMMQSSQQKDIQHKIQKQLQEHQLLLQQQRKIDELHAHLLQQHPMHMDKEMQKKVHLQMQHKLMQKHKQMEEKFHQQVQHHIQHHQDPTSPKSSVTSKPAPNQTNVSNCSHAKPASSQKNNHKCATSAPWLGNGQTANNNSAPTAAAAKTANSISPSSNVTHKNSTTQTTAASAVGQNRARQQGLPDVVKSTSYICPKHSETNKNLPHNHADHCNSSDNSSDEDCCSERSNSPQRHCDCCYCEVFGPQSAPVSRNFQETRERLRLILTKKKAKSNSAPTVNEKQAEPNAVAQTNIVNSPQPASQGIGKVKKEEVSEEKKMKPEYKGDKSIEEILDFIEGNKIRNAKRTAKQMRRKQRQLEEEERRRKEEEAERQRLAEIRRQEEEKRRIEEERRRQELLKEQNRKKNKKKTSKLNQQLNLLANEHNNKKNKKNQTSSQQPQTNDKNRLAQIQSCKIASQKQNVQQTKQPNQQQQQQQKKGKHEPVVQVKQGKQKVQEKQKMEQPTKNSTQKKPQQNQQKGGKDDNSGQPQMVTIKRVMQPNSSEPTVTITLRGPTPKEDKVLYTLLNGQMCQVKDEKGKKQAQSGSNNVSNKKPVIKPSANVTSTYNGYNPPNLNPHPNMLPKSVPFNKSCSIIGNGVNSITERMERLKLGPHPAPNEPMQKMISAPTATQAELTTPTAIQINQAVNQLSSRPSFPNSFDLENIKLPPGITITKVDPATVNRKPIQMKQQAAPPPPPQTHVRQTMMPSMGGSSNVIVVDTADKNNYYQSEEQAVNGMKKKRRRRNKNQAENGQNMNNISSSFGVSNGLPPRMGSMNAGMYGNPFMNNDYRNPPQQPAAIIQMNGSMVTIRNPALHQAMTGQQMDYHDGTKVPNHGDYRNSNLDENMLSPAPEELENGDVDEYERELEAFKRFCSQSVPAESKPKVNLNLEDIVLKKKGPVIGCS